MYWATDYGERVTELVDEIPLIARGEHVGFLIGGAGVELGALKEKCA